MRKTSLSEVTEWESKMTYDCIHLTLRTNTSLAFFSWYPFFTFFKYGNHSWGKAGVVLKKHFFQNQRHHLNELFSIYWNNRELLHINVSVQKHFTWRKAELSARTWRVISRGFCCYFLDPQSPELKENSLIYYTDF